MKRLDLGKRGDLEFEKQGILDIIPKYNTLFYKLNEHIDIEILKFKNIKILSNNENNLNELFIKLKNKEYMIYIIIMNFEIK